MFLQKKGQPIKSVQPNVKKARAQALAKIRPLIRVLRASGMDEAEIVEAVLA